jgi:hypothetical protein
VRAEAAWLRDDPSPNISLNRKNGQGYFKVACFSKFIERMIYSIKPGKMNRIGGKVSFEIRSS